MFDSRLNPVGSRASAEVGVLPSSRPAADRIDYI